MRIPMKQVGLTAVAAGFAATAAVGAWGSWSTTDNDQQSTDVGVLDLDMSVSGTTVTTALGTEGDPLVPGDSGCRVIRVVNDGTIDFTNFRVHVVPTISDGGSAANSQNAGSDVSDTDGDGTGDAKFRTDLTVAVKYKDSAYAETACAAMAAEEGVATAVASTALKDIDTSNEADPIDVSATEDAGVFIAPSTRGSSTSKYLLVSYTFSGSADAADQGVTGSLDWIFDADQRAAATNL